MLPRRLRFNGGGRWQRLSTNERDLATAKTRAFKLLVEANVKKNNIAPITRAFKDVAKLAIKRMEKDLADGTGKVIYNDYIAIVKNHLIASDEFKTYIKGDVIVGDSPEEFGRVINRDCAVRGQVARDIDLKAG